MRYFMSSPSSRLRGRPRARSGSALATVFPSALLLAVVVPVIGLGLAGCDRAPSRPNIVVIAIDTLRPDHVGAYGHEWIATPQIDALARDGVVYERCWATSSWTLPSFASFHTGLLPQRHTAVGGSRERLPTDATTVAEHLAAAGYATGALISIHWLDERFGMDQGFAEFSYLRPQDDLAARPRELAAAARAFVNTHRDEPFYLFLHWYEVHAPYEQPPAWSHRYYEGDERAPGEEILPFLVSPANRAPNRGHGLYDWLGGVTDLTFPRRAYAAGVAWEDSLVGAVLENLRDSGLYEETLVMLVSDHGEHLGEHDTWFTHHFMYDEVLRVPLIVKWPDRRGAGSADATPVSLVDALPTLLRETGLGVPAGLDGCALQDLEDRAGAEARAIVGEWGAATDDFAKVVVAWPWKLMLFNEQGETRHELYDLSADPAELHDLAARHPDRVATLEQRLWAILDPDAPVLERGPNDPAQLDPRDEKELRALGY